MRQGLSEQYVVFVDGEPSGGLASCGRCVALGRAIRALDSTCVEVIVADARTWRVFAYWRRRASGWSVRAVEGWLN